MTIHIPEYLVESVIVVAIVAAITYPAALFIHRKTKINIYWLPLFGLVWQIAFDIAEGIAR